MDKLIMIKYGELSTKKDNIKVFIEKLHNNIKRKLKDYDITITKNKVRMFIDIKDNDETIIIKKLKEVFGIHSIVICYKVNGDIESIKKESYNLLNKEKFNTFKVETNRADKNFPYNSMEISKLVGAHILKNIQNIKVDVHNPDIILHVEVRSECSYIYTKEIYGLGGYPTGIQGKGLLMLSGGIDSPVAGFLANKRGVDIDAIYYESPPHTSIDAKNKVISLAKELHKYGSNINLYVMPFTKIQEEIYKNIDPTYMITIMRRMMYRISVKLMEKNTLLCLINGESVGQVASQTLTSIRVINSVTNVPVIRPVACLDKLEIIEISRRIGTYETSILPYEDCCTIFLPKHPVINPSSLKAEEYEKTFDYQSLIEEAVSNEEVITISNKKKTFDI